MNLARLVAEARPAVHWTDQPARPIPGHLCEAASAPTSASLVVASPASGPLFRHSRSSPDVAWSCSSETCGFGASTRNGGFADVSLTHGVLNGLAHWPDDFDTLERLGRDNLDNLLATVDRYAIACHAHRPTKSPSPPPGGNSMTSPRKPRPSTARTRSHPDGSVRCAGTSPLPHVPRRARLPRHARSARSRSTRLGARRCRRVARRHHPRRHPGRGH